MIGLFGGRRKPAAAPAAGAFRSGSASHVGRIRRVNEDRVLDRPNRGLWAVADGMGGLSRGDVAAETAIAALAALADHEAAIDADAIVAVLDEADRTLRARNGDREGGTTIIALLADADGGVLVWAGDSRGYRLGSGPPERLTRDHSLVADLVDAGLIPAADADHHPQANVVTRALGAGESAAPETRRIDFGTGDRVLLATDGLYRSLAPGDAPIDLDPLGCAERLVANAVARDGSDNASCVVVERLI